MFAGFSFEEVRVTYTVAKSGSTPARELLISG